MLDTLDPVKLATLPREVQDRLTLLLQELEDRKAATNAQNNFLAFIAAIDKPYKFGNHLKRLGALLTDVEQGKKDRIAVSMAPRMGKSQMISIYYPAWYLGKHPDAKVIVASHTADLAIVLARKVRNLMQSAAYQAIFPEVQIAADAKAAGQWNTNRGGEYYATGVGGALAGRGADLIIVDDPISEQALKGGDFGGLDSVYEWFSAGLRTRLMPNGKICVLHCLVGDTPVMLATGVEKPLRDIRPGDMVASYDKGVMRPAKVLNWANQGLDHIYSLRLRSGVIIRGNERHPFLVSQNGVEQWIKIKDLKPGMHLVCATNRNANNRCTPEGNANTTITKRVGKLQTHLLQQAGGSGKAKLVVQKIAQTLRTLKGYVLPVMAKRSTPNANLKALRTAPKNGVTHILRCNTGSLGLNTIGCLPSKVDAVLFAKPRQIPLIPPILGKYADLLLTIAIQPVKYAHYFATHVISSLKTEIQSRFFSKPLSTLNVTLDEIVSITPDGEEDVYDIQVEGTENFLANGVVSHNTRWHQRDLIGRLIKDSSLNPDGDQYEIFEFPAILEVPDPEDPEQTVQKSLWPEQWSLESLLKTKASMANMLWQWNAQYMQDPTAAESAMIKREWIKWWEQERPPNGIHTVVQSWDTALTAKERSDYSYCTTWGVWDTEDGESNVILLDAVRGKYEFPELKQLAYEQYKEWEPDNLIIETKASGHSLVQELRRSGIYVQEFSPGKGQDKIARLNTISDMFASGHIWFPETSWANSLVEELLAFPAGEHDDGVDSLTLALTRIRQGGILQLRSDKNDDDGFIPPRRNTAYY